MRIVHQTRGGDRPHAEPLCGDWGSMDTDWTDAAGGVTCPACTAVLREQASRVTRVEGERAVAARRADGQW